MKQYLKILLPFLEEAPISKSELMARFRSHFDATNGNVKLLFGWLSGLQFYGISKQGGEVVIYD
jgi:hypothetical protein